MKIARATVLFPSLFCVLCALSIASAESAFRPQFTTVSPGLDYSHFSITNFGVTNQPWSIHIARMDRSRKDLDLLTTLGQGTIQGLASLSAQTKSIPPEWGVPLAAVNGDFFLIKPGPYQGDPEGLQILHGELVSAPGKLSFWAEPKHLSIEAISSRMKVTFPDGSTIPFGLNQTPSPETAVLFTPIFGRSTRATNFTELVLERFGGDPWLPLRANHTYRAGVRSINNCGDTSLNPDTAVLTIGSRWTNMSALVNVGAVLRLSTALSKDLSKASAAIGGGPLLVHRSKAQEWPAEKSAKGDTYLLPRHPRTALGFNSRYFFLIEVDGRQKDLSIGMSFAELASFMKQIGCAEAMNLDGGGSATFWLDGKVVNSPSDKHERALANAIIIARKPRSR